MIDHYTDRSGLSPQHSNSRLARAVNCCERTVRTELAKLTETGWLEIVERKPGQVIIYQLGDKYFEAMYTTVSPPDDDEGGTSSKPAPEPEPPKVIAKPIPKEALQLASRLKDNLLSDYPFMAKSITEGRITKWAVDIDRLHRIDGVDWDTIAFTIAWVFQDDFWKQQIHSGRALRKHFIKMAIQIKANTNNPTVVKL